MPETTTVVELSALQLWMPAIVGLAGAAIGALGSIGAIWLQSRADRRNQRLRMAVDLALEEHKRALELALNQGSVTMVAPILAFLFQQAHVVDAIDNGKMSPEELRAIYEKYETLADVMMEYTNNARR